MLRFLMIDPKRIELSMYNDIPHLLHPVVTEPKEATRALKWAVEEMERRYWHLSDRGVRNIEAYNRKVVKEKRPATADRKEGSDKPFPYIIVIIDELADLMMTSSRDVEEAITRLAQMARAAGNSPDHCHTEAFRGRSDGIIKANFPARISFQVSSKSGLQDHSGRHRRRKPSRTGRHALSPPGVGRIVRIHGAYISEEEIKKVTDFLKTQMKPDYDTDIMTQVTQEENGDDEDIELDEKFDKAVEFVIQTRQASISMIQRKLRVGYNRAARMIEAMEKQGSWALGRYQAERGVRRREE